MNHFKLPRWLIFTFEISPTKQVAIFTLSVASSFIWHEHTNNDNKIWQIKKTRLDKSFALHFIECVIKRDSFIVHGIFIWCVACTEKQTMQFGLIFFNPYFKCKWGVFIGASLPVLWQWVVDLKKMEICHQQPSALHLQNRGRDTVSRSQREMDREIILV